jgi:alpha-mannosidase
MWVEADCNLSGPESLARQFLLGRNFFREAFGEGAESPVLWLPDVFGYAWNLPQLVKEAGLEYFFTIKIGWSQYNRLPYDSFWWQGLDGTKVLTHFSTTKDPDSPFAATYNSDASPSQTLGTWLNFQQKDYGPPGEVPPLLMSYGYGDGGGGPTREMLENIQHMTHFPSTPKIKPGKVGDFFKELRVYGDNLPIWNGELYLEYHRGTYTTQARNKRANRKSEFLLHDAEFLATYAFLLERKYIYPYDQFKKAWKLVCLNQFHDIIPGSSISDVYKESLSQYQEVRKIGEGIRDHALRIIAIKLGNGIIAINPTSFNRNEVIEVGTALQNERTIPAFSVRRIDSNAKDQPKTNLNIDIHLIENDFVRIEINENGDIDRIFDKNAKRDVIPDGMISNQFLAFEDIPLSWDAWDIDIFYDDKVWLAEKASEISVVENGPFRAVMKIKRKILNSIYTQLITLTHNSPRIDFDTVIDWQERQVLLKVAFPVAILSPTATYEIQWGNVERPTHRNTSWDWARFETAAQKWVDLSEGDYGVSLLNDCKYGHDIHENNIRLTLLRGTTVPDPLADIGKHKFRYSLLPHSGCWGQETVREAYAINDPLIVYQSETKNDNGNNSTPTNSGTIDHLPSLVSVDQPNIIIETIKRAEDGNGIIIRLYEYQRRRCMFLLKTVFPMDSAWRTNLLEENQVNIPVEDAKLEYSIKPYQILTLRLVPNI